MIEVEQSYLDVMRYNRLLGTREESSFADPRMPFLAASTRLDSEGFDSIVGVLEDKDGRLD